MNSIELLGPFELAGGTSDDLAAYCGDAVYVLGIVLTGGYFDVYRVGRTSSSLIFHLELYQSKYAAYKYILCNSVEEAYSIECSLFHDYQPRHNVVHPLAPLSLACPICGNANRLKQN